MSMKAKLCLLLLLILPWSVRCYAERDGLQLSESCNQSVKSFASGVSSESSSDAFQAGICLGLVRGVMESMMFFEGADSNNELAPLHGCIPAISPIEAIKVVIKFLNDHPNRLHEQDVVLVIDALSNGYPCPAPPTKPPK